MAYLLAFAQEDDLPSVQRGSPETWRRVRRYNLPVQLALASAEMVMRASQDPSAALVVSLAPCQPGSAELYRWGDIVTAGMADGNLGDMRMNPTQTLHAVDNLAMSAFAITYGNRAECLGLGGAAGQAWCGLEAVRERIDRGAEEVLLMAGDQDMVAESARGLGVALLFAERRQPFDPHGRIIRLIRTERGMLQQRASVVAHSSRGLSDLFSTALKQPSGLLCYQVPAAQTDGSSSVTITLEISS